MSEATEQAEQVGTGAELPPEGAPDLPVADPKEKSPDSLSREQELAGTAGYRELLVASEVPPHRLALREMRRHGGTWSLAVLGLAVPFALLRLLGLPGLLPYAGMVASGMLMLAVLLQVSPLVASSLAGDQLRGRAMNPLACGRRFLPRAGRALLAFLAYYPVVVLVTSGLRLVALRPLLVSAGLAVGASLAVLIAFTLLLQPFVLEPLLGLFVQGPVVAFFGQSLMLGLVAGSLVFFFVAQRTYRVGAREMGLLGDGSEPWAGGGAERPAGPEAALEDGSAPEVPTGS